MNKKAFFLAAGLLLISAADAVAQRYISIQRTQIQTIKNAQRRGSVTQNEYRKLMDEQDVISETIAKARYDGVVTARERDAIAGKQQRAANRLRRYKHNGERY